MSIEKSVKTSENLFVFPQIEPEPNTDNTLILEELSKELQEFLLRENNNVNSTDGVFEFLAEISNQVQGEFAKLLSKNIDKNASLSHCKKYSPCLILPRKF